MFDRTESMTVQDEKSGRVVYALYEKLRKSPSGTVLRVRKGEGEEFSIQIFKKYGLTEYRAKHDSEKRWTVLGILSSEAVLNWCLELEEVQ